MNPRAVCAWARANLFATWRSTAISLALGYLTTRFAIAFVLWAFVHAVWTVPYNAVGVPDTRVCTNAHGIGACWAVVAASIA